MIWAFLILLLAAAIFPFWQEKQRKPMTKTARIAAPGKFARLSQGVTHYQWTGSVRGPVAICVHGLTTPSPVWDVVAEGVGALGYRVLRYDLYGRGYSDAPHGTQDAAFFEQQLLDLMADQNIDHDVTLIGYSMGGAIVTAFADAHPHLATRLILIAPSGIHTNESQFSAFCRQVPYLGDWLMLAFGGPLARRAIAAETEALQVPDMAEIQLNELDRQGFLPAVLSSRRGLLQQTQESAHRAISRNDIPVVAIWGAMDQVIPVSALGQLTQWNRQVAQEVISDAGHALTYTHGQDIATILQHTLAERPR